MTPPVASANLAPRKASQRLLGSALIHAFPTDSPLREAIRVIDPSMKRKGNASAAIPPPSATVILIRDGQDELETLLVRRNSGADPFAGAWVFPGGAIETADGPVPPGAAWPPSARSAAARELFEETGLRLSTDDLVPFAEWTSPPTMPHRFLTWFFLAAAPSGAVQLSRQEVDAYRWISPHRMLAAHRAQSMMLFPPTWISLHELTAVDTVLQALRRYARRPPAVFAPRVGAWEDDLCFFYQEDAAYAHLDAERPGPRHRLRIQRDGWRYERNMEARGGDIGRP